MPVKAKIRLDYKANGGPRKFLWQRQDLRETAKEIRVKNVALLRNLPFQGLNVADFDLEHEVFVVPGDGNVKETAYAPVELTVEADSLEELMQFTLKEEFRKIKILEPEKMQLSNGELERFLFKMNVEYRSEIEELE